MYHANAFSRPLSLPHQTRPSPGRTGRRLQQRLRGRPSPPPASSGTSAASTPILSSFGEIGVANTPALTAVARFFAPWIHQGFAGTEDFLTRVTFDGDWEGRNNWENTHSFPNLGEVYVSVSEDLNLRNVPSARFLYSV